jgi:hypothetical protein
MSPLRPAVENRANRRCGFYGSLWLRFASETANPAGFDDFRSLIAGNTSATIAQVSKNS